MSKICNTKKDRWKWFLIFGAVVLVVVMIVGIFLKLGRMETNQTLSNTSYSIGSVDTSSGKVIESRQNAYTKSMYKVDNMEITLSDDATISYKVFFYDKDKDFISATNSLNADFDLNTLPSSAEYFRVVITPAQVDGENVVLNLINLSKYTNQIRIVVVK